MGNLGLDIHFFFVKWLIFWDMYLQTHWRSYHDSFSSMEHSKVTCNRAYNGREKQRRQRYSSFFIKWFYTYLDFSVQKWREDPTAAKIWKRKKKEKRYTINSENDVNTKQTRAQAWRSCPLSLHEPHHIHWISEGVNSWRNHPLLGWDRRVYFMAEDTICWNKPKLWSVAVSFLQHNESLVQVLTFLDTLQISSILKMMRFLVCLFVCSSHFEEKKRAEQNTWARKSTGFDPWRGPLFSV